jgi:hypothetical protein
LLRPADRESIAGDLLEEYREVRRPALGAVRADAWYIKHVVSVLWRLVWPFASAVIAVTALSFPLRWSWNHSIVQAPAVSVLDGLIYLLAGYYGSQRTALVRTGIITAGATSILAVTAFLAVAAIGRPSLLLAPFEKPFIFVIVLVLLLIAFGYGAVLGSIGGVIGRWLPPARRHAARLS